MALNVCIWRDMEVCDGAECVCMQVCDDVETKYGDVRWC